MCTIVVEHMHVKDNSHIFLTFPNDAHDYSKDPNVVKLQPCKID